MSTKTNASEGTRKSLMKKTKAELIDIIYRKDDVEITLRDELKVKTNTNEMLNNRIHDIRKYYESLNDDFITEKQELITEKQELHNKFEANIKTRNLIIVITLFIIFCLLMFIYFN